MTYRIVSIYNTINEWLAKKLWDIEAGDEVNGFDVLVEAFGYTAKEAYDNLFSKIGCFDVFSLYKWDELIWTEENFDYDKCDF